MKLTEKQKKMKVDWDSYERAGKALEALFGPKISKSQLQKGKKD
ncbi:MAG: hypothetical protein Q9M94_02040 [Candidatus Gracilibacteria bacterium]|nr:hypothetical protein [Candidatus Gracilibacteria bacterium]MDQ7023102.1 hypothetical protein [Candidatus Gracilibacteria bacterium]